MRQREIRQNHRSAVVSTDGNFINQRPKFCFGNAQITLESLPIKLGCIQTNLGRLPLKLSSVPTKLRSVPIKLGRLPFKLSSVPTKLRSVLIKLGRTPTKLGRLPFTLRSLPTKLKAIPINLPWLASIINYHQASLANSQLFPQYCRVPLHANPKPSAKSPSSFILHPSSFP